MDEGKGKYQPQENDQQDDKAVEDSKFYHWKPNSEQVPFTAKKYIAFA